MYYLLEHQRTAKVDTERKLAQVKQERETARDNANRFAILLQEAEDARNVLRDERETAESPRVEEQTRSDQEVERMQDEHTEDVQDLEERLAMAEQGRKDAREHLTECENALVSKLSSYGI